MRAERRRRGRDIRRARRFAAAQTREVVIVMDTRSFSRSLAATTASLSTLTEALTRLNAASLFTARVAFERLGLAYLLPHAGARRQLLHQGRAPKGRR